MNNMNVYGSVSHVAKLCAVAAMTAPKAAANYSEGGTAHFYRNGHVEEKSSVKKMQIGCGRKGDKHKATSGVETPTRRKNWICFVDRLIRLYPPKYDCGAADKAPARNFFKPNPTSHSGSLTGHSRPVCQLRALIWVANWPAAQDGGLKKNDTAAKPGLPRLPGTWGHSSRPCR